MRTDISKRIFVRPGVTQFEALAAACLDYVHDTTLRNRISHHYCVPEDALVADFARRGLSTHCNILELEA